MGTGRVDSAEARWARAALTEMGMTEVGPDRWIDAQAPGAEFSDNDVAHTCAWGIFQTGDDTDPAAALRLGFGLLDLLDEFWVMAELSAFVGNRPRLRDEALAGIRRRLEASPDSVAVEISLSVEWFEGEPAETAANFAALAGDDLVALPAAGRLRELAAGPVHRRVARVLKVSGPVPWTAKYPGYRAAAGVPELHDALFHALLSGYHDIYGSLEPAAALSLLRGLTLPPGTEPRATLDRVLAAGHANHFRSPEAWGYTDV